METRRVIEEINSQLDTCYTYISKFSQGEWGAYLVAENLVLKYFDDLSQTNLTDSTPKTSQLITNRLKSLGSPVSKTVQAGQLKSGGYWWLLERVNGKTISVNPQGVHIKQLLQFLDLHKNQAVSQKQNWSKLVKATVFGESKQKRLLLDYSENTSDFLNQLLKEVDQLREVSLRNNDIVHGDMSYHQLLVEDEQVTAILDWQEAGCGDWLIDLSRLVYSLHDRPPLVKPALKRLSADDMPKLRLFTAFHILDYLYWPAENSPKKVEAALNKAKSAFKFVFRNELSLGG